MGDQFKDGAAPPSVWVGASAKVHAAKSSTEGESLLAEDHRIHQNLPSRGKSAAIPRNHQYIPTKVRKGKANGASTRELGKVLNRHPKQRMDPLKSRWMGISKRLDESRALVMFHTCDFLAVWSSVVVLQTHELEVTQFYKTLCATHFVDWTWGNSVSSTAVDLLHAQKQKQGDVFVLSAN